MSDNGKFKSGGEYYGAWGKAYRLHVKYAESSTDDDMLALANDIRLFDSDFERALMVAVVQEIERTQKAGGDHG